MEHTPPASSPWALKSQQEIIDFLSAYAERQQPLPTTFKRYLGLFTDNSDEMAVQYLRQSKLGVIGATWRLAVLFIAAVCTSLLLDFFLQMDEMLLLYLSFWLPPAIVFGRLIYSRRQLSQIYRIDADLITHHFDDLLKPLIKTYNSSRKAGSLSSRETAPLVSSMMSFQEMYPLVPAIPRLDREPVPWDGPKNPYKPHFVRSVLRDDWSPGMRYMFSRNQHIHFLASTLDDVFFLPAPWKLITAFSAGAAFIFIDLTVRFGGIHLYYVGRSVTCGLLIAVLFYILMAKDIPDYMSYPVYSYGPNGDLQSITFWNLYKAFRREVLPFVKAAHKDLITPADLEQVYASFRARYPIVKPNS